MSNIKLNCCGCGKELGLGSRVSSDGVLWRCEECAIKQREEYDNKDQKIADLEAKLAESEKNYTELFCRNIELETLYSQKTALVNFYKDTDLVKENKKLKQQLAEKDANLHQIYSHLGVEAFGEDIHEQALKEIRRLLEEIAKKDKQLRTKIENMKSTDFIMMCLECGFWIDAKEKDNQDKISFAVDKLEKVKEWLWDSINDETPCGDVIGVREAIDNQIKQLKEGCNETVNKN